MADKLSDYPELQKLFNRNSSDIKVKIVTVLNSQISKSEYVGYVYGFYSPDDKNLRNNFWIKLGRTERNPFVRVEEEWKGELIFCLKTHYNHRLERLIHLFFDFAREKRLGSGGFNGNCEIKQHEKSFFEKIFCCFKNYNETDTDKNLHFEIEWFHFKEKIIVESLVAQIKQLVEETYDIYDENDKLPQEKKININVVSLDELLMLPGIGKKLGNRIIDSRQHKKFESFEELQKIHRYLNCDKLMDKVVFN